MSLLALRGSLRWIARQQLIRAGEDTAAAREIADRLDGKVAQGIIGGDEDEPAISLQTVTRVIVEKSNDPNGGSVPPAPTTEPV